MTLRSGMEKAYGSLLRVLTAGRGIAWHVDTQVTLRIDPRCRWIRNPSYEAEVVDYMRSRIRPGDVCLDVGAHVGFYALQMALWTSPGGKVIAFEPNPTARDVLTTNVRLNSLGDRITVEPYAVGAARGTAPLFHGGETTGLSRIGAPNPATDAGAPVQVDVVALDDYCTDHRVAPRWVLIDTEGLEVQVLEGAKRLLANQHTTFVVEMHPTLWENAAATQARFDALLREYRRRAVKLTRESAVEGYGTVALVKDAT